jgi:transcriptional regulator with XRE-family HTH domain
MRLDHERVHWHRDRLGWTLETLAEKAEVAKGTVLRAEHGEDVRPGSGRRIAQALGAELSDLIPDKPGRVEELVGAGKAEAPREAGRPGGGRSAHDIARGEARRQFEIDAKAFRRTIASEGTDRAARVSDIYAPAVYDALKRQPPDELAGTLLDAERHVAYLEQENAALREALSQAQAALEERGQGAQEPADAVRSTNG